MEQKEEWRPVKGFEGLYEVSNLGNVRSLVYSGGKREQPKPMAQWQVNGAYLGLTLHHQGRHTRKGVANLVAEAFIPNPENRKQVRHRDGDITNNCADNLEWGAGGGRGAMKGVKYVRVVKCDDEMADEIDWQFTQAISKAQEHAYNLKCECELQQRSLDELKTSFDAAERKLKCLVDAKNAVMKAMGRGEK